MAHAIKSDFGTVVGTCTKHNYGPYPDTKHKTENKATKMKQGMSSLPLSTTMAVFTKKSRLRCQKCGNVAWIELSPEEFDEMFGRVEAKTGNKPKGKPKKNVRGPTLKEVVQMTQRDADAAELKAGKTR